MSPAALRLPRPSVSFVPRLRLLAAAATLALLAACGTTSKPSSRGYDGPGYHTVQANETLSSIARRYGQDVNDLVRWNKISNPNRLYVSQVLQVVANPRGDKPTPAAAATSDAPPPPSGSSAAQAREPARRATVGVPPNAPSLVWPAEGPSTRTGNRAGVLITGSAGAPVRAAAAGNVAYVDSGLRGYGNMVIIRHSANFMTVYAHNRRLMAREGANVRQGEQIAEMGDSDNDRVGVYFEVRHNGEPIDPLRMLPKR